MADPVQPPPACGESYGFLPCSNNAWGALFLAVVYGYAVLRGAVMIGDGGEALMDLKLAPAVIGGLVLPIIGALPDALIIINSGLHESRSEAREEISVGMGTLAGSTVMLLTIVWGGSVLFGRCDLDESTGLQHDKRLSRPWFDLVRTGVSTDTATPRCAWAMLGAALLYLIVQLPYTLLRHPKHSTAPALAGCILCFLSLAAYCAYQVLAPGAQRRRIKAWHKHALRFHAVRSFSFAAQRFGGLVDASGRVRREVTTRLFNKFRKDECGCLDASDIRAMLIGLEIAKPRWGAWRSSSSSGSLGAAAATNGGGASGAGGGGGGAGRGGLGLDSKALDDHVSLWMREFDRQGTGRIDEEMFHRGVERWVAYKLRRSPLQSEPKFKKAKARDPVAATQQLLAHIDEAAAPLLVDFNRTLSGSGSDIGDPYTEDSDLESASADSASASGANAPASAGGDGDGGGGGEQEPWQIGLRAGALLAAGTALCAVFSDPLVGSVTDVSRASGIHPFFVAFIFMPLASNASELVSSLAFAASQTSNHISVTFNQVYGAVVMNSTLCFGCFLAIIRARRLPWTFGPEVAVIVLPTLLLAAFATRRRSWPAAWGLAALGFYPLALLLQWALRRAFHEV
ncbi:hypothetical protein Rsub_04648 [Raphidocelis subcapitata]|uniref:Sodium/calcium exchanger membrane region domain-containing protein n=1 Tax=Raphidocelis subcapitata TaxID=307507 RepID=A0A2V0NWA7_9CHLO|nr:hypothetical protein Rsub_04648 [Raphidocelis subcapitata]|eukprot:GBF91924.1 hypothetical protein Rsub_04648 [Raphidocelis subcapitata]